MHVQKEDKQGLVRQNMGTWFNVAGSWQPSNLLLTAVESWPWLNQEAPIWLLLFYAKDLLCCKHWSRGEE